MARPPVSARSRSSRSRTSDSGASTCSPDHSAHRRRRPFASSGAAPHERPPMFGVSSTISADGRQAASYPRLSRSKGGVQPMTTPFLDKPTLVGDLVTLRPIRAEDADLIDRIILDDEEIPRLTGAIHSSSEDPPRLQTERLREIYGAWGTAEDRLVLGVVDNVSDELVGEVVLNDWDEGNRSCGFRALIGTAGRGRGLGTEATRLIVGHGLTTMGLHRISLEVYDFNPRARRVYEKVGFVHEGTGREALLFDGKWIDVHYMAMIGG